MSKRLLLFIIAFVAALITALTLLNKNSSPSKKTENAAFISYINAYTSGIISTGSTIRILLTNEIETPIEIGKPI